MGNVDSRGGCAYMGVEDIWEISLTPSQFCHKTKTAQKESLPKKTNKIFKIQQPFMIKMLRKKKERKGHSLNSLKSIYKIATDCIVCNSERLKVFPLISETRQGCLFSPLLFESVLEVLASVVSHGKEIKGREIIREKIHFPYLQMI